jgi:hypothetical protein
LQERAMNLFANNEALRAPILKYLWLEGKKVNIGEFKMEWEKWKLILDIWEWNDIKRITLNAWMKFGYFTQCVNHTVILNDISAETEDWTSVQFNSWVWENGSYIEWNKNSMVSKTEFELGGAVIAGKPSNQGGWWETGQISYEEWAWWVPEWGSNSWNWSSSWWMNDE